MMLPRRFYFDDALDHFFDDDSKMKCDIYEKDDVFHIEMDLPGFTKDEIKVECNNGNLIISAEKNNEKEDKEDNKKYLRKERVYGKYSRSFYLGDIKEDEIEAKFENGILHISVPKLEEKETKKYIDIK